MTPMITSKTGYIAAAAIGAGFAAVSVNDAYVARDFGWLRPITSFSKTQSTVRENRVSKLSANEIAEKFREEGLPVAVIAEISGVERKTVYAWFTGSAVRGSNQERLDQLYEVLFRNKVAELRDLYRFWNRPLEGGVTLGSLLKQATLDKPAIENALRELWPIAKRQHTLAKKNSATGNLTSNPFLRDSREVGLSYEA